MAWPITDGDVWSRSRSGDGEVWDAAKSGVEFPDGLVYDGWRIGDSNFWSSVDAMEVIKPLTILRHALSATEVQLDPHLLGLRLQFHKRRTFLS